MTGIFFLKFSSWIFFLGFSSLDRDATGYGALRTPSRSASDTSRVASSGKQEALRHELVGRFLEGSDIGLLGRITLLEGRTRVSGRQALGFGRRERDETAGQGAESVLEEILVEVIPAGVGADRRLDKDIADAAEIVAVGIDLRDQRAVARGRQFRRIAGDDAGRIGGIVLLAVVLHVQRIVVGGELHRGPRHAAIIVGGNAREPDLIGRDQIAGGNGRAGARRRLGAILHPCGQMAEQRPHGPVMRVRIGLLLAKPERLLGAAAAAAPANAGSTP